MNRIAAMAVLGFGCALSACHPRSTAGPFSLPRSREVTIRADAQPNAAGLTTTEGNHLFIYARSKADREVASALNIPAEIMGYTRLIPKEGVPWIRAYSHRRADGAQMGQVDYRRINDSAEIRSAEVISINRFIIFRDHVVIVRGLLTKGDLEKDYWRLDRLLEDLVIRE